MRKIKKLTALMLCALLMLTLCPIALAAGNSVKIDQKPAAGSEMIIDFGDDPQLTATVTANGQSYQSGAFRLVFQRHCRRRHRQIWQGNNSRSR
jgi:hypothetical protein